MESAILSLVAPPLQKRKKKKKRNQENIKDKDGEEKTDKKVSNQMGRLKR